MAVNLNKFYHVNINVTDIDRSIAFYQALGFRVVVRFDVDGEMGAGVARSFGTTPNAHRAAFLQMANGPMMIDLCEYSDPPTTGKPQQNLNHAGMVRLAFHVDEIEPVYNELKAMGVEMLGPLEFMTPPGGTRSGVFAFYDPDGTILEVLTGVEHMAQ